MEKKSTWNVAREETGEKINLDLLKTHYIAQFIWHSYALTPITHTYTYNQTQTYTHTPNDGCELMFVAVNMHEQRGMKEKNPHRRQNELERHRNCLMQKFKDNNR